MPRSSEAFSHIPSQIENQALDRIHRLGQQMPVITT
jgi:hypothetical protein